MFDDYMMRMIKQLTEAISSIVRKLRGGKAEDAAREIEEAYDALLEHNRSFLDMVDPNTLATLIVSADKVLLLAQLSWLDANLARVRGDSASELRLRARARALLAIAARDQPGLSESSSLQSLD